MAILKDADAQHMNPEAVSILDSYRKVTYATASSALIGGIDRNHVLPASHPSMNF